MTYETLDPIDDTFKLKFYDFLEITTVSLFLF